MHVNISIMHVKGNNELHLVRIPIFARNDIRKDPKRPINTCSHKGGNHRQIVGSDFCCQTFNKGHRVLGLTGLGWLVIEGVGLSFR